MTDKARELYEAARAVLPYLEATNDKREQILAIETSEEAPGLFYEERVMIRHACASRYCRSKIGFVLTPIGANPARRVCGCVVSSLHARLLFNLRCNRKSGFTMAGSSETSRNTARAGQNTFHRNRCKPVSV